MESAAGRAHARHRFWPRLSWGWEEKVLLALTRIDCHEFHLPQHGLMRPEVPPGAEERANGL